MEPKKSCEIARTILNRRHWTLVSWGSWFAAGGSYWLMPPHSLLYWGSVGLLIIVVVGETGWMLRSLLQRDVVHS